MIWLVMLPLLNPLVLWTQRCDSGIANCGSGPTIAATSRTWHRWAWAVAVILISIPHQTVWLSLPADGKSGRAAYCRVTHVGRPAAVRARRIADSFFSLSHDRLWPAGLLNVISPRCSLHGYESRSVGAS